MSTQAKRKSQYNDLDVSNWRAYEEIETGTLWNFDSRDRQGGHKLDYHGNCIPQILTQLYTRFTQKDDVVVDLFLGSGTSAIEALNMERRAIGVELKPELVEYVSEKLHAQGKLHPNGGGNNPDGVSILCGDSSNKGWAIPQIKSTLAQYGKESAQFAFLHPPYADIIQFSESEHCLSNADSTEAFLDQFEDVAQVAYDILEPGRFAAVVIGDKYANGELIPLGFQCLERMNAVGFKTKSIIVKNITGNEKGKGRLTNLWRYRALVGGFYIFKHEYVLVFRKPESKKRRTSSS